MKKLILTFILLLSVASVSFGQVWGATAKHQAGFKTHTEKVYIGLLTQSGTGNPVATVIKNTFGGAVIWTRTNTGSYTGTLVGAFTEKTVVIYSSSIIPSDLGSLKNSGGGRTNDNEVYVLQYKEGLTPMDGITGDTIEIRVYP